MLFRESLLTVILPFDAGSVTSGLLDSGTGWAELSCVDTNASSYRLKFSLAVVVVAFKVWKTAYRVIYHSMGQGSGGASVIL